MIGRIVKAALIAWVGKKIFNRVTHDEPEATADKPVRRAPARKASAKPQAARRRAA